MNDSMNTQGAGGRGGSNRMLVAEFEYGRAPGEFHHADHVRVAFAYVAEFPLLEAIGKFSAALQRFAISKGKPQLYHQTITWAYLLLIHERLARGLAEAGSLLNWEEFSAQNPDLLVWKGGILERYYSREVLDSDVARRAFVFPDVRCGPDACTQSTIF
ncbi:MAG: hypothetical protein ABSD39_13815 [Terriglobales bacterium]|jgi:hypothetical protein